MGGHEAPKERAEAYSGFQLRDVNRKGIGHIECQEYDCCQMIPTPRPYSSQGRADISGSWVKWVDNVNGSCGSQVSTVKHLGDRRYSDKRYSDRVK